jgi:hypothetical protein
MQEKLKRGLRQIEINYKRLTKSSKLTLGTTNLSMKMWI